MHACKLLAWLRYTVNNYKKAAFTTMATVCYNYLAMCDSSPHPSPSTHNANQEANRSASTKIMVLVPPFLVPRIDEPQPRPQPIPEEQHRTHLVTGMIWPFLPRLPERNEFVT